MMKRVSDSNISEKDNSDESSGEKVRNGSTSDSDESISTTAPPSKKRKLIVICG